MKLQVQVEFHFTKYDQIISLIVHIHNNKGFITISIDTENIPIFP